VRAHRDNPHVPQKYDMKEKRREEKRREEKRRDETKIK
jgi:hypothetical protein